MPVDRFFPVPSAVELVAPVLYRDRFTDKNKFLRDVYVKT